MDWTTYFPAFVDPDSSKVNLSGARKLLKDVEIVDIGCGFGGLLVGLAPVLPDTLMLGMLAHVNWGLLKYGYMANSSRRIRNGNPASSPRVRTKTRCSASITATTTTAANTLNTR